MPGKVLLIEDDVDMIEAMKVTLQAQGYQVYTAFSPDEGMSRAQSLIPDLIVLDVMFGSDQRSLGMDFAVKIRQDKALAKIPVLMITAINVKKPEFGFSPQTDGEFLPVDDFINKPAQPEELLAKVTSLISQKTSKWSTWPEPSR